MSRRGSKKGFVIGLLIFVAFLVALGVAFDLLPFWGQTPEPGDENGDPAPPVEAPSAIGIEALVGVWEGTFHNTRGLAGKQMLVYQVNGGYGALIYFFPVAGSPENQVSGQFLADVSFHAADGQFEIEQTTWLDRPTPGFSALPRIGRLDGDTFHGSIPGENRTFDFSLHRTLRSDVILTVSHTHLTNNEVSSIELEPTCIEAGAQVFYCVFCGEIAQRETLQTLPHTQSGWLEVVYVPDTGWTEAIDPTCLQDVSRIRYCTVCDDILEEEALPAPAHVFGEDWVVQREPTCDLPGYQVRYCTICEEAAETEEIPSYPHEPSLIWLTREEATCTNEGIRTQDCLVCGLAAETQTIPQLPHTPSGDWIILSEATCYESGYRAQYCTVCDEVAMSEVIPAFTGSDHDFAARTRSGSVFVPPIVRELTCTVCGFAEEVTDFSLAWVSPVLLVLLIAGIVVWLKLRKKERAEKEFVCPFCFETHLVQDVQFRCENKHCEEEYDVELSKYNLGDIHMKLEKDKSGEYKITPEKGRRTFSAPKAANFVVPKEAECEACNKKTHTHVCPSCHNSLPESTLTGDDIIISIIGSRGAGKSQFVGVVIHELEKAVFPKFGGTMLGLEDTLDRYKDIYESKLYNPNAPSLADRTTSSLVAGTGPAYRPFIYTVSFEPRGRLTRERSYSLVFYDTAGEDLAKEEKIREAVKHIRKSSGIIFVLDPVQLQDVQNELEDKDGDALEHSTGLERGEEITDPNKILSDVSALIRRDGKSSSKSRKISTPVAAVFSKLDALVSLLPPGYPALEVSPHRGEGAFDDEDQHNINSEIESLLKNWGETGFVMQLRKNYKKRSYFAISALGLNNTPKEGKKISPPRPHRVEDPILWILNKSGVIPSKNTLFTRVRDSILAKIGRMP